MNLWFGSSEWKEVQPYECRFADVLYNLERCER
jgi:hypothetical protein